MRLKEYHGKELFKKYNIPIPNGVLVKKVNQKINFKREEYVVKAQVLHGYRQKLGLIKFAKEKNLKKNISELLKKSEEVLVEEKLEIDKQFYVSLAINREEKNINLIFSREGGIDIEDIAEKYPKKIKKISIDKINSMKLDYKLKNIIKKMIKLMKDYDCMLVEINPLIISKNKFVALDSKIIIDDNALYRYPEFRIKDPLKKKAFRNKVFYVDIDGDIPVIGNGAGLVMTTMDMIKKFGGKPASFLDVGGGGDIKPLINALEICIKKKIKGIFVNIFAGITGCDEVALALLKFKKKHRIRIPIVVRIIGDNEEKAREIFEKANILVFHDLEPAVKEIVRNVYPNK